MKILILILTEFLRTCTIVPPQSNYLKFIIKICTHSCQEEILGQSASLRRQPKSYLNRFLFAIPMPFLPLHFSTWLREVRVVLLLHSWDDLGKMPHEWGRMYQMFRTPDLTVPVLWQEG
jgi:hypothetical protein